MHSVNLTEPPIFICRCSAIGDIMTDPQGKTVYEKIRDTLEAIVKKEGERAELEAKGKAHLKTFANLGEAIIKLRAEAESLEAQKNLPRLSATCTTYLKKWLWRRVTGKRVEFTSKQTDKGNIVEKDSINYASLFYPEMMAAYKNTKFHANAWIEGTPDVDLPDLVADMKASFTHETFPAFNTEPPDPNNAWQVTGYMALLDAPRGAVIYTLMDMPEGMIEKEARYQLGQYSAAEFEQFAKTYRYGDLPDWMRLKRFEIEREDDKIQAIYRRVEECRIYIKTVLWPELVAMRDKFLTLQTAELCTTPKSLP